MSAIAGTLERTLGLRLALSSGMAAPLVLKLLGQTKKNLDKAGVAQLLQQEFKQFTSSGSDTSRLVMKALDAGKEAMSPKLDTPQTSGRRSDSRRWLWRRR